MDGVIIKTLVAGGAIERFFGLKAGDKIVRISQMSTSEIAHDTDLVKALVVDAYQRKQEIVVERSGAQLTLPRAEKGQRLNEAAASSNPGTGLSKVATTQPSEVLGDTAKPFWPTSVEIARDFGFTDWQKEELDRILSTLRKKHGDRPTGSQQEEAKKDFQAALTGILTDDQRARIEAAKRRMEEVSLRVQCASNLKKIGLCILLYSNEHKGKYPPDLKTLYQWIGASKFQFVEEDVTRPSNFLCPARHETLPAEFPKWSGERQAQWIEENTHYVYKGGGLTNSVRAEAVVMYEQLKNHVPNVAHTGGYAMNFLFGDGHVEFAVGDAASRWANSAGK